MFIESPRFPDDISEDAQGGPRYSTSVTTGLNGATRKNINWTYPLHSYDVAFAIRSFAKLCAVRDYFYVAKGRAHSFRFKDWGDYKSCDPHDAISHTDQEIGTGDGSTVTFQIVKNYTVGPYTERRVIKKPVNSTVIAAVNGTPTSAFSLDDLGRITFDNPPANNAAVTVGYEFDVPVSFEDDELPSNLESYDSGSVSVTLVEERL